MNQTKAYAAIIGVSLFFALPVFAAGKTVVPFSAEQASRGFTAALPDNKFSVIVPEEAITGKGSLSLRRVDDSELPSKPFAARVSNAAEYHINSSQKGELAKPITIELPLTGEAKGAIRLHFFDKKNKVWRPLASRVDEDEGVVRATTRFPFSIVAAFRDEALRVRMTKEDVKEGKVIESPDENFTLDIPEKAIERKADVIVKRFEPMKGYGFPAGTKMVSPAIYEYTIKGEKIKITEPVRVTMSFEPASETRVSVYVLDKANRSWKKLPSQVEEGKVSVETKLAFAPLVVLKDETVFDGVASWYSGNTVMDAATNHFPIGTRVRVTNVETGASIEVKVVSTWKGTSGRVIDLTRSAFEKIAKLGAGVVKVRIEKI